MSPNDLPDSMTSAERPMPLSMMDSPMAGSHFSSMVTDEALACLMTLVMASWKMRNRARLILEVSSSFSSRSSLQGMPVLSVNSLQYHSMAATRPKSSRR